MKTFMVGNLPAPPPQTHKKKTTPEKGYPRNLQHTPGAHPRQSPGPQLWKDSLYNLLVKVARGVVQFGVLKQPKKAKTPGKFITYPHLRRWFSRNLFCFGPCFGLQVWAF